MAPAPIGVNQLTPSSSSSSVLLLVVVVSRTPTPIFSGMQFTRRPFSVGEGATLSPAGYVFFEVSSFRPVIYGRKGHAIDFFKHFPRRM